jgi:hypothetical protein
MAATLPAAEQQDQAREARLRMNVDAGEIDRLHLAAAATKDIKPAIPCLQRGADRGRPVVRRRGIPALDDRRATLAFGSARPGTLRRNKSRQKNPL